MVDRNEWRSQSALIPESPRDLARQNQCTFRRGYDAGCPCVCPLQCQYPTAELAKRIAEMDPNERQAQIDRAYLAKWSLRADENGILLEE